MPRRSPGKDNTQGELTTEHGEAFKYTVRLKGGGRLTGATLLCNQVEDLNCSGTLLDELLTERAILQKLRHHQTRSENISKCDQSATLYTNPQQGPKRNQPQLKT